VPSSARRRSVVLCTLSTTPDGLAFMNRAIDHGREMSATRIHCRSITDASPGGYDRQSVISVVSPAIPVVHHYTMYLLGLGSGSSAALSKDVEEICLTAAR